MCTLEPTTVPSLSNLDPGPSVHGRPVLQPACNRVPTLERRASLKKISPKTPPSPPPPPPPRATKAKPGSPPSPRLRSPRPPAVKRPGTENPNLSLSSEKLTIPKASQLTRSVTMTLERKKSKKWSNNNNNSNSSSNNNVNVNGHLSTIGIEMAGSIAAGRREQMALQHAQRKMRIAHYGRSKSANFEANKVAPLVDSPGINNKGGEQPALLERRCTSITPNSDPLYVAYHDEEWGVPVHDDKMLFELLVLSGAQVGSDWTSILRKRQDFREAFSGFDAEIVGNLTEKQIASITAHYAIDISRVRAVVDNANGILQVKKEFGSFEKYIWGFVNGKPISPQYKFAHKIPVKTSKSESISKDLVRRGFRAIGPTAVHSFMQAAGLTNDHLITCFRQLECTALASCQK